MCNSQPTLWIMYRTSLQSTFYTVLFSSLLFTTLTTPQSSHAQRTGSLVTSEEIEVDIIPRLAYDEAGFSITTQDKSADLLLTDAELILQFTDDYLENIAGDIRGEDEVSDTSHFASVLRSAISSGVRTLLDRALAIPLYEIEEIYYRDGRLVIINRKGEEMFEDTDIDGILIMEDFSRRDARRFVAEAEKRME